MTSQCEKVAKLPPLSQIKHPKFKNDFKFCCRILKHLAVQKRISYFLTFYMKLKKAPIFQIKLKYISYVLYIVPPLVELKFSNKSFSY